jgi:hypothetical protein
MRQLAIIKLIFVIFLVNTGLNVHASTAYTIDSENISDFQASLNMIAVTDIKFIEPNDTYKDNFQKQLDRIDDIVIISSIFTQEIKKSPKYSFSIYQITLRRLDTLSKNDFHKNKKALDLLLLESLNLSTNNNTLASLESSNINQCLCAAEGGCGDDSATETCSPNKSPNLTPLAIGGLTYGLQSSNEGSVFAGTTATYDTDLVTTWSARQEYKNMNLERDVATANTTINALKTLSGSTLSNTFDQLGVNDAYGYGFSGDGVTINFSDDALCQTHVDMIGKTITTFGTVGESTSSANHGCHVVTAATGRYHLNASDTLSGFSSPYEDSSYTVMGVAYNSDIHFAANVGAGSFCNGGASDTDCWGPQHWELTLEDAKLNGAKVSSNSWGFDEDLYATTVSAWATDNDSTNYEALVHFQSQTNVDGDSGGGCSGGACTEIGLASSGTPNWTTTEWQEYISAIDSFQETGVYLSASSNDNNLTMSTVWGTANNADTSSSLPYLFPELSEAWISVVNVISLEDGTRALFSSACSINAAWCLSHDGFNTWSASHQTGGSHSYVQMTGTSMATPQVAGAVAILFEAFPDNSPELITKRLLLTADNSWLTTSVCYKDTNSSGTFNTGDSFDNSCGGITGTLTYNGISHGYNDTYGHGNPDLYAALQPIGSKSVSDSKRTYALIGSAMFVGSTFGNSLSMSGESALFRDQLNGGFKFNLSDLVSRNTRNEVSRKLRDANHSVWSPISNNQGLNFSYSSASDIDQNGLADDSGFYSSFVSGNNTIFTGRKYSVDQVLGLRNGNNGMSVLTAHNSNESFLSFTESASNGNLIGSKIDIDNSLSFNVIAYNGVHSDYDLEEKGFIASVKHTTDANSDFSFFVGKNTELEGLLRTSGQGAFGNFAGEAFHIGTTFNKELFNNVYLAGLFNYGLVEDKSDNSGFLTDISEIKTTQFNIGMVASGFGNESNLLSFNISQPLRVESGVANLTLPGLLDSNGNVTHTTKQISLEPSGREFSLDLGYEMKLFDGAFKIGSQMMFDASHMESNNTETIYGIFKKSF